jgi:ribosomal protein S18 acetylase RimI-like enzyme
MRIIRITLNEAHLVYDLFDQYRIFYKKESDKELAKSFIDKRLANNESVIFVALNEDTSEPMGFTQLYPTYSSLRTVKNWILNDLFVNVMHRKKGIGEALIETVMLFAKDQNANSVELSTAVDNYTAQSLYTRLGFEKMDPELDFLSYKKVV